MASAENVYIFRFRRVRKVPAYGDGKVAQDYTVQSHAVHVSLERGDQPKPMFTSHTTNFRREKDPLGETVDIVRHDVQPMN